MKLSHLKKIIKEQLNQLMREGMNDVGPEASVTRVGFPRYKHKFNDKGIPQMATNNPITATWNCAQNEQGKPNSCVDFGFGNGPYSTLADCEANCGGGGTTGGQTSWDCMNNSCQVIQGLGGAFVDEDECMNNGCGGGPGTGNPEKNISRY